MMNINAILNDTSPADEASANRTPPTPTWPDVGGAQQATETFSTSPGVGQDGEWKHEPSQLHGQSAYDDAETPRTHSPAGGSPGRGSGSPPVPGTISATDEAWGMEVDSASSSGDTDSAIGSDIESSTVSLRESIFKYVEENGRTYHAFKEGKYILPNDEAEQERLDLQHHLFSLTLDEKLHLAPLHQGIHNVLDIGTGTGLWAIEFAQEFPSANVLGSDLSPIQPMYVPANCRFEVSDAEETWNYSQKFDYIHGRAMLSCFRDPQFITYEAFASLRPGGYFEIQDPQMPIIAIDETINGTALQEWGRVVCEAAAVLGRPVTNSKNYGTYMANAGFVDIEERHFYWPVNPWPKGKKEKLVALWTQQNLLDGIQGMSMAVLTRGLGWTSQQVELLLVQTRKDIQNRHIHAYIDVVVWFARKPE